MTWTKGTEAEAKLMNAGRAKARICEAPSDEFRTEFPDAAEGDLMVLSRGSKGEAWYRLTAPRVPLTPA